MVLGERNRTRVGEHWFWREFVKMLVLSKSIGNLMSSTIRGGSTGCLFRSFLVTFCTLTGWVSASRMKLLNFSSRTSEIRDLMSLRKVFLSALSWGKLLRWMRLRIIFFDLMRTKISQGRSECGIGSRKVDVAFWVAKIISESRYSKIESRLSGEVFFEYL